MLLRSLARFGPIGLLVLGLASCRATSYQNRPLPDLSVELSDPAKGRVYVFRDSQLRGELRTIRVFENQREIGAIEPGGFLCWERIPGRTVLRVVFEGPAIDGGNKEGILDLQVTAGEIVYSMIQLNERSKPVAKRIDAQDGRAQIDKRSPAQVRD